MDWWIDGWMEMRSEKLARWLASGSARAVVNEACQSRLSEAWKKYCQIVASLAFLGLMSPFPTIDHAFRRSGWEDR